jgi:tripartite-type tricarboxylate transporter receptor subunit TctC
MRLNLVARAVLFAVALATLLAALPARAQTWPGKPIRLIVPYPAGGTADLLGRKIGQKLGETLGQHVVIENRAGAGGGIGADLVAKAKPDGYTLLMGTIATHAINPNLYPDLAYDAVRDFAPIALVAAMPNLLVVNPSVPAGNVRELIALAKSKPGELAFASAGSGTTQHLSGELFKKMAGVDMMHIPYKGNAPAVADLVGGQVQVMFDNIPISLQQVRAGKLRALAVTGPKRNPVLPDVPTIAEAALPGYSVTSWFALFAPAGTPAPIVARLNSETNKALADTAVRRQLADQGIEPVGGTAEQLAAHIRAELPRWKKIVAESGARVE